MHILETYEGGHRLSDTIRADALMLNYILINLCISVNASNASPFPEFVFSQRGQTQSVDLLLLFSPAYMQHYSVLH